MVILILLKCKLENTWTCIFVCLVQVCHKAIVYALWGAELAWNFYSSLVSAATWYRELTWTLQTTLISIEGNYVHSQAVVLFSMTASRFEKNYKKTWTLFPIDHLLSLEADNDSDIKSVLRVILFFTCYKTSEVLWPPFREIVIEREQKKMKSLSLICTRCCMCIFHRLL